MKGVHQKLVYYCEFFAQARPDPLSHGIVESRGIDSSPSSRNAVTVANAPSAKSKGWSGANSLHPPGVKRELIDVYS